MTSVRAMTVALGLATPVAARTRAASFGTDSPAVMPVTIESRAAFHSRSPTLRSRFVAVARYAVAASLPATTGGGTVGPTGPVSTDTAASSGRTLRTATS